MIKKYFKKFISSATIENFFLICVIVNSVYLALEGIIVDENIQIANFIFTLLFLIECFCKLIGFGIESIINFFFFYYQYELLDYWRLN